MRRVPSRSFVFRDGIAGSARQRWSRSRRGGGAAIGAGTGGSRSTRNGTEALQTQHEAPAREACPCSDADLGYHEMQQTMVPLGERQAREARDRQTLRRLSRRNRVGVEGNEGETGLGSIAALCRERRGSNAS